MRKLDIIPFIVIQLNVNLKGRLALPVRIIFRIFTG